MADADRDEAPRRREVLLTAGAERDLAELRAFLEDREGTERADHVLDRLRSLVESLATLADRGSIPHELQSLGIREFRQVFFKPYRVVYRVRERAVIVQLVADGRRDMQALLIRRMLSP